MFRLLRYLFLSLSIFNGALFASESVDFVRDIQPILKATCYSCHGSEKQKGGLRLDSKTLALQGGSNGKAIEPGQAAKSYILKRIRGEGEDPRMPPKGDPLKPEEIAKIVAWINEGANWPDSASVSNAAVKKHWAYEKPALPKTPEVSNLAWVKTPLDAFVLAKLDAEKLNPSPEATKEQLIRRVSLDLTGLPPSPAEIDAFIADASSNAYEKLVDRLLASPHYGERWARPWLDLARYADTEGFNFDAPRVMWHYRDWVINAINADMPYDQFTISQLAGDLLPNATADQKIATGFHRNTMLNTEGGVDPEEARWERELDRTNTTSTVWMGSTIGCAQCHNHKFDPFTQKDFYRLFAYFDNTDEKLVKVNGGEVEEKEKKEAKKEGKSEETALIMAERKTPASTFMRIRGSFVAKGEQVDAGTPGFLPQAPVGTPNNRLGLARWLVSPENPLTARVTVNRLWENYFGHGLVETSEDFGLQGTAPSHPELLDFLACEFMKNGWKFKPIHKMIVMSSVYRQSSKVTPELLAKDPYNKLLARAPRYRLEAELIRDNALSISGQICLKVGGPSVYPPMPPDKGFIANNKGAEKWVASTGEDLYRRGLYTFWRRTAHYATFANFDAPSREFCTVRRSRTNNPMQALSGLNDPGFFDSAKALAERLTKEGGAQLKDRIAYGFRLCTARLPNAKEQRMFEESYAAQLALYQKEPQRGMTPEQSALTLIANVLLNMDETLTRE